MAPHATYTGCFRACELLEQTGFFSDDTVLVETSTHVDMGHTEVFLALPAQADYVTLTVPDPFNVVHQLLLHIAPDATPPYRNLPLGSGEACSLCQLQGCHCVSTLLYPPRCLGLPSVCRPTSWT